MTPEQVKQKALQSSVDKAFADLCDGDCKPHKGECLPVVVEFCNEDWYFSYCQAAREVDVRQGFKVTVQDIIQMSRVEETRTPEQRAKQELGFDIEGRER